MSGAIRARHATFEVLRWRVSMITPQWRSAGIGRTKSAAFAALRALSLAGCASLADSGMVCARTLRPASCAVACLLLLTGCSAISAPLAGQDPSDPNSRVPRVSYRSTIGAYSSQRPVSPGDWLEQNERVAPRSSQ